MEVLVMNAGFDRRLPCTKYTEDHLETYALGRLSEEELQALEEHLLICPACQDLLAKVDEYIEVMKAAVCGDGRRRLAKPVETAVLL
jgi:anti-sigma factor RsiW